MEILTMEQGTEEWFIERAGIVTMSEVACLLVNGKSTSGLGAGAFTYMNKLIGERITGEPAAAWEGNMHTERGKALEPEAIELYCEHTGAKESDTERVGLIRNTIESPVYGTEDIGYSPDLLIGNKGAAEIKTKLPKFMVEILLAGEVPKEHIPQCQGGLWASEREWIDFVAYWPGMPLFVKRIYRDKETIEKISDRTNLFYEVMFKRYRSLMME